MATEGAEPWDNCPQPQSHITFTSTDAVFPTITLRKQSKARRQRWAVWRGRRRAGPHTQSHCPPQQPPGHDAPRQPPSDTPT